MLRGFGSNSPKRFGGLDPILQSGLAVWIQFSKAVWRFGGLDPILQSGLAAGGSPETCKGRRRPGKMTIFFRENDHALRSIYRLFLVKLQNIP